MAVAGVVREGELGALGEGPFLPVGGNCLSASSSSPWDRYEAMRVISSDGEMINLIRK